MRKLGKFDWLVIIAGLAFLGLYLFVVSSLAALAVVWLYMVGWL